jgi:hypothetical protein
MTGFWVCPADANGDRILGAEVRVSPGPVEVDYPMQASGTHVTTDGGRVIHQDGAADPRTRAWVWRLLPAAVAERRYDRLIALLETLLSWNRRAQGFSPFVYLRDDETDRIGRWAISVGTATAVTPTTLTDASKNWAANRFAQGVVEIWAGGGTGLRRSLVSNTSDTLTLADPWGDVLPSSANYAVTGWVNEWVRARVTYVAKVPTSRASGGGVLEDMVRMEFVIEQQDTLLGHWMSDTGVTLIPSTNEVQELLDQSGFGSHLEDVPAGDGPTWASPVLNGYPAIFGTGTVRELAALPAARAPTGDFAMIAVAKLVVAGGNSAWFWTESERGIQFGLGAVVDPDSLETKLGGYIKGVGWVFCDTAWIAGQYAVIGAIWSDRVLRFYRNGALVGRYPNAGQVDIGGALPSAWDAFSVDGATDGTGSGGAFAWAEWMVYDGPMSSVRLQARQRALCDKYAIAVA